ncbi:MAG: fluoride efflux transporter CrcB [Deltaproteobacteria bacterium]|nr:MAG: fluoride efflux transporter CrcB [Deltaproteobacteria bacterium]
MTKLIMIIIGAGLGALLRYAIAVIAGKYFGALFPVGTLLVNFIGCFLIGVSITMADRTQLLSPTVRLFFLTGFLGSLTTFSTYALETFQAARNGSGLVASLNVAANNIGGIFLVFIGMWLTQVLLQGK